MKKEFDIKFNLKDEVFFSYNGKIINDKIIKYRISVEEPFSISQNEKLTEYNGITVEYYFIVLKPNIKEFNMKDEIFDFVWINQNDVYKTEDELMETP